MFYQTTCVGLRYGHHYNQTIRAGFLGSRLPHLYPFHRSFMVLSGFTYMCFLHIRNGYFPLTDIFVGPQMVRSFVTAESLVMMVTEY